MEQVERWLEAPEITENTQPYPQSNMTSVEILELQEKLANPTEELTPEEWKEQIMRLATLKYELCDVPENRNGQPISWDEIEKISVVNGKISAIKLNNK